MASTDALSALTAIILKGAQATQPGVDDALKALFGGRYRSTHLSDAQIRNNVTFGDENVPFAGLINPDNPPSGPYGGASLVWFPAEEGGSLLTLVVGTRGLSPDEGILTRPGHRRRIVALRRYLARRGLDAWTKTDPAALSAPVPRTVRERFPKFEKAFSRYGDVIYLLAPVEDHLDARLVVQAFFDLYAYERRWQVLKEHSQDYETLLASLREDLFPAISPEEVYRLLLDRRFVILEGPPGTGKTRLADLVKEEFFKGQGLTIQFHPAITYEDFVVGLSPVPQEGGLHFDVRRGYLLTAIQRASQSPFLFVVDEINRGDLGKVLGEAIYLFEAAEIGRDRPRRVAIPHAVDGSPLLEMSPNLYLLATMNTADRSIAGLDLAIRRRFAFVSVLPDRRVVADQAPPVADLALQVFDEIASVFIEHAPEDSLVLLPGHSYFLADTEEQLRDRLRFELLPLLNEYLREGYLAGSSAELQAVRDRVEDMLQTGAHGDS